MMIFSKFSQIKKHFSFKHSDLFIYTFLEVENYNLSQDNTVDFRRIDTEDFSRSRVFKEKGREARYLKHIVTGHQCYGYVTGEDEVASYLWVSINNTTRWDKRISFKTDESSAYIWDCRTCEKFYRKGLYYRGLLKVCKELKSKKNIQKAFIACDSKNLPSKAGIIKAGFKLHESFSILSMPFVSIVYFRRAKRLRMAFNRKVINLSDFKND